MSETHDRIWAYKLQVLEDLRAQCDSPRARELWPLLTPHGVTEQNYESLLALVERTIAARSAASAAEEA